MRLPTFLVLAVVGAGSIAARAADATSPVDAAQRNAPYAPGATVVPEKQAPNANTNERVQDRRYETKTVERQTSPLAGRRAAIDLTEAREKNVREKESRLPEVKEQPVSAYNHRTAAISTGADTTKPPTVTRYQESLTAASTSNMARFPAFDGATTAKINRFVFRKNPTDAQGALEGAVATPAASGSDSRK